MFKGMFRPKGGKSVASATALAAFLDRNASLVSQKTIISYCNVKTHLPIHELVKETAFAVAYDVAVWEGYVAVLADLIVVAEGYLRPQAGGRTREVADRLIDLHRTILAGHPIPACRPQGWDGETEALERRLAAVLAAPPLPIRTISETSAARLFTSLPIHERLRSPDQSAVVANAQFLMVGLAHEFEDRIDHGAVVADLLATGAVAPA